MTVNWSSVGKTANSVNNESVSCATTYFLIACHQAIKSHLMNRFNNKNKAKMCASGMLPTLFA